MMQYTQEASADVEDAVRNLQNLTDEQLKNLIEDETSFEEYFKNLSQIKKWEAEKDMLMASNKSLAEFNLTFEPKLQAGKATLMELYEQARGVTDELETKRAQLESLYSRTSLDTTHALLQTASMEAEEESDKLAEQFLAGSVDVETFVGQFEPLRCKAHMRKLKTEKMAELVTSSQRGRTSFSTAVPYPTSPPQMPMPGMPMPM
ncbi:unnamed protein product [Orchesella dallaii]|uniref:VPS37 C-terminal domain-containing protein n=1 Tax=Orchesella dallaii TaxID=48710 RepID=A0ABP1PQR7_9HEXA